MSKFEVLKLGTKVKFKPNPFRDINALKGKVGTIEGLENEFGLSGPLYIVRLDSEVKTPSGSWISFTFDHCFLEVID